LQYVNRTRVMIVLHTLLVHSTLRASRYQTLRHTKLLSLT